MTAKIKIKRVHKNRKSMMAMMGTHTHMRAHIHTQCLYFRNRLNFILLYLLYGENNHM